MREIYHLVPRNVWEQSSDPYEAETLASEGFIHCSSIEQLTVIANLFYREVEDLLALCIDAEVLSELLRDEKAALPPGLEDVSELQGTFPHLYGPIPRTAIRQVIALKKNAKGEWELP